MADIVQQSTRYLLGRLLKGYVRPYKGKIIFSMLCMVVVSLMTAGIAYMVKPMLDEIFVKQNEGLLLVIPFVLIGLFVVKGIASYIQVFLLEESGQGMVASLQKDLYRHLIHQDMSFYQRHSIGDLSARFIFDLNRVKMTVTQCITGAVRDFTTILGLISVMFYHSVELSLLALVALPLATYPIVRFGKRTRKYAVGTQEEIGGMSNILKETFSHHRQVKAYTMEGYEKGRANSSIEKTLDLMLKSMRIRAMSSPIMELLGGLSIAFIIGYGGHQVVAGETSPGTFFSFLTALMTLYRPIKGVANINNALQEGLASAQRTFDLLDEHCEIKEIHNAKDIEVKKGKVEFKNITLTYADGTIAIDDLSLIIPAGKSVALVGASGAGKSSLLNLIPRFFDPSSGEILVDGQDISKVTLLSLRENIGLVTQELALFNDSIAHNIGYGKKNAMQDEIEEAAKAAAAHDFILETPEGYETIVGEDGVKLSGGQKQRITIARAMLKNAPILLLDEATSNLDTESEERVQEALNKLMKGRTTLVVAHRLSTIVNADKIYVLDKGKIVEQGTHTSLLEKNGAYAKLYRKQSED